MLRRVFCKLLLVAIVIFSFLVLSGSVMAQGRSEEAFERVKEVQERHALKLMTKKGVVGAAIGLNEKGKHIVLVFLEKPGVAGIPKDLEGVPVKQKVTGKIYALGKPAKADKPPKSPTGLTAVPVSKNQINLDWNDNREKDVVGYNVYCDDDPNPVFTPSSSYSDEGLAPSTTHYYFVTAVDAHNQSDPSNEVSATTLPDGPPDTTPPMIPTGLTATTDLINSSSQINLDWDDNNESDFDHYNVYRSMTAGGPYGYYVDSVDISSYSNTELDPGTTYYYVVTAVDTSDNESNDSGEASAATEDESGDTTPPAVPTGLTAATDSLNSNSQINLDWNDNGELDFDHYNVYRSDDSGGPYSQINLDPVLYSDYSDIGLTSGTTYFYVVTAIDTSDNESEYSIEDSATTDSGTEPIVDRKGWCSRPVPIGVSTGHFAITAGTIGCRLTDGENIYALSNNHVYADENNGIPGLDNVLQPGPYDGGVN
ncbi:MAG: fibronectin type III domain-containing protein, partial [Planctomycetota bacterium]